MMQLKIIIISRGIPVLQIRGYTDNSEEIFFSYFLGALVAQWVKFWPTDLVVPSLSPARGKRDSTAHSLSLSCSRCPDMTEILLKRM